MGMVTTHLDTSWRWTSKKWAILNQASKDRNVYEEGATT